MKVLAFATKGNYCAHVARRTYPLRDTADRILGGQLNAFITEKQAEGLSFDAIAMELWKATGEVIRTSGVTIQKWAEDAEAVA